MTKTAYKTITSYGQSSATQYRRVYQDTNGKRYVKINGEYRCIEGTKCLDFMFEE